jgi:hypothetical protein
MSNQLPPPHVQLIQMGTAYWASSIVYAAAEIGLADHLAQPKSARELAGPLGLHSPTLHRMMRSLAGLGLLTERDEQRFALTPLGAALRSDAPGFARSSVRTLAGSWLSRGFEHIVSCIQTGETGFAKVHGVSVFEYLATRPAEATMFSETMVGIHGNEPPAVAAAYDFSAFDTVVDVGGATGNMLASILTKHARPRGVLFDQAHVVGDAPALLSARGVSDRVSIQAGSFFESVPAGGDAYVLSHILHDWSEERCLTILGNCRRAMKPAARLLIVEMVIPAGDTPHLGKILDIAMLVGPGGQERTEAEYAPLLAKAGFKIARVVPTESAVSVVEAVPA